MHGFSFFHATGNHGGHVRYTDVMAGRFVLQQQQVGAFLSVAVLTAIQNVVLIALFADAENVHRQPRIVILEKPDFVQWHWVNEPLDIYPVQIRFVMRDSIIPTFRFAIETG